MSATVCRSCGAAITWATTASKRRRVPLDPAGCPPLERGALLIVEPAGTAERWAYSLDDLAERVAQREGLSFERAREVVAARYPAFRAHFATCPSAREHRRRDQVGARR